MEVTAETIILDLTLLVDRIDLEAETDDAVVTLLPGETAILAVLGASEAEPESHATRRQDEQRLRAVVHVG